MRSHRCSKGFRSGEYVGHRMSNSVRLLRGHRVTRGLLLSGYHDARRSTNLVTLQNGLASSVFRVAAISFVATILPQKRDSSANNIRCHSMIQVWWLGHHVRLLALC
ncbi:hypothetical protein TNCV_981291 [Trichonephila clavipes]|uniref:Uncharacterized protein n=1 Tax=Trichonephila clavipes TaxID=2585209 RepID=A0A8X6V8D8_TRICX|nr:hypothetical protein TNCV_981291 [Trichonephila clavipes]